jgi:acyl-CoA dehydrogenase
MEAVIKADPIEHRIRAAQKEGKLPQRGVAERRLAALNQGLVTKEEYEHLLYTDRLRHDVVKVDDFEHDLARGRQEETWQSTDSRKKLAASM